MGIRALDDSMTTIEESPINANQFGRRKLASRELRKTIEARSDRARLFNKGIYTAPPTTIFHYIHLIYGYAGSWQI